MIIVLRLRLACNISRGILVCIILQVPFYSRLKSSIQFWSGFIPVNGGGRIYPSRTPTLHLDRFMASFFSKPALLLSSTCVFHVFFGRPRFLLPLTEGMSVVWPTGRFAYTEADSRTHLKLIRLHK